MAIENGTFANRLNVDRFFMIWARIESQRAGVQITYIGKRLKKEGDNEAGKEEAEGASDR